MNISKLERDKRELCEGILRKTIEEKYEELKLDYVEDFKREKANSKDFQIFALLHENGAHSGIAKCSECATKFQARVENFCEIYF